MADCGITFEGNTCTLEEGHPLVDGHLDEDTGIGWLEENADNPPVADMSGTSNPPEPNPDNTTSTAPTTPTPTVTDTDLP